jgi:chemotaxis signal transduction protein
LTSNGTQTIGLIADAVTDVLNLNADQMIRAADVLPAEWPDMPLVQGIVRTAADGLWLLLDLNHLFQPDQVQLMLEASARLSRAQMEAPVSSGEVRG